MRPIITSLSEIRNFKRCRMRWRFGSSNHWRLSPRITGLPFQLGTSVHAALAAWTINPTAPVSEIQQIYLAKSLAMTEEAEQVYRQHVGVAPNDAERAKMLTSVDLGLQMVCNYMEFWRTPLEPGYRLIEGSEQEFLIDIPGTPHKLKGFLDHAILNEYDQLLALDRKTYEKRPSREALLSDEQFVGYTWALGMIHGFDRVAGVAYDGLWKRLEPNTKYKQEWGDLFLRLAIKPTSDQLQNFQDELVYVVTEMAQYPEHDETAWEQGYEHDPAFYKNRNNNCLWDCKEFIKLCDCVRHGEDLPAQIAAFYRHRPLDEDRIEMRRKYELADDSQS